jgi:hypothetical protein
LKIPPGERAKVRLIPALLVVPVALNGMLLVSGNFQGFLPQNRELAQLPRMQPILSPGDGELLVARSTTVDDFCGWVVLISPSPVMFCTDAEVMLTPTQNREIHRFRQALYLYLVGEDSGHLRQALADPDPAGLIWKLGYWAEALSPSSAEGRQGINAIESDLIPRLERIENHDAEVAPFFQKFRRVIVIDHRQTPTFSEGRLASFLTLESERISDDFVIRYYVPR